MGGEIIWRAFDDELAKLAVSLGAVQRAVSGRIARMEGVAGSTTRDLLHSRSVEQASRAGQRHTDAITERGRILPPITKTPSPLDIRNVGKVEDKMRLRGEQANAMAPLIHPPKSPDPFAR